MTVMTPRRAWPSWLLETGETERAAGGFAGGPAPGGKRRRRGFLAKTLTGISRVFRQTIFAEEIAARRGPAQRLDPRVKLVTILGLLIVVGLVRSLPVLAACYLATVGLAVVSGLPLGQFLTRVWLFVPAFTGLVVLPATLSVVTPGEVVVPLWHWNGAPHGLTAQGLYSAGLVLSRVATSVSLVVLLTLTTRWARLLAALRSLGVPKIFVLTIAMAYRYLFLLLEHVEELYTARKARGAGLGIRQSDGGKPDRRVVAASIGALFARTHQLSVEIYQAMVARGFTGSVRTLTQPKPGVPDVVWTALSIIAAVGILLADQRLGG
ncbi:MAG: cobalt ECF transporter T component CbiQ [Dactylosporangium sp.]|nr:cobalt ECF transporter T component CbiQ [Dactylosporangium sp.]NNJ61609.1 cobalt ECF transporter T component CbiQ [Dactylosporangium sp.]